MNEIRDFQFESLPVPAVREFLHELYEATEGSDYVKTQMTGAYTPWKNAYETMAHVYELPLGNVETTNTIFGFDTRRDLCFKAFEIYVKLAKLSEDPEMVTAAEALERTMTSFPVNVNGGYLSQTAQMDSFLAVALGDQLEATTKVGALQIVQEMKRFNDQVHALVASRDVLRVERDQLPSRPVARQAAIDRWRFLAKFANSVVTLNFEGTVPEGLAGFIELVNKKWERYESIYLGGSSTKPEGGEGGEGSEEEGGEGSGETTPTTYTLTFEHNGETVSTQQLEAGAAITPPAAPTGYHWVNVPATMPAQNLTITTEEDEEEDSNGGFTPPVFG